MVKLYCDKCGKEITDKYYTVCFAEHYIRAKTAIENLSDSISTISTYIKPTAFEELNSHKMYCSKCKVELECE